MTNDAQYSRLDKLNDAETILYEIDMLRFAMKRLLSPGPGWSDGDEWIYLEAFLLHYRNLVEFFSGRHKRIDDLSIAKPADIWGTQRPERADLDLLTRPDLYEKYDTTDNREAISKYLHHCTKQRIIKKKWAIKAMFEDLRPVIEMFESLLPAYKPATGWRKPRQATFLSTDQSSTASTRVVDSGLNPMRPPGSVFPKKRM